MKVPKLYISGPMSGQPNHGFPAFRVAARLLRDAGFEVLDPSEFGVDPDFTWEQYLRRDIAALVKCDAVALLHGWAGSRGAQLETHIARELGMAIHNVSAWLIFATAVAV